MDTTDRAVELRYGARRRDAWEVLGRRALRTPGGRGELLLWLVVLPLVPCAVIVLQRGRGTDPAGLALAAGVGVCLGALCAVLELWRRARRMYRWAAEHPEYRCVITERGTHNHRPDGTAVVYPWSKYRGWAETRGLFVFVFANGELGWLPKRSAATPEDLDRVRELLGANLPRV
ncbi:YcxB family protein [Streptomyces sp. NPDC048606]|uniref:YcxB family protein n=1 Tax=Streptomyces sp. NPDC048606 TaxID=3154726 RepID=UPI00343A0651